MKDLFDKYVWVARILPGAFVMLPPVIALIFSTPAFEAALSKMEQWTLATSGFLISVGLIARHAGKHIEPSLWQSWGGPPATRMLRWSDPTHSEQWKQQLHFKVHSITGIQLLEPEEERDRPDEADNLISDACSLLRTKTRNLPESSLLQKANTEYGLARNLLGCRWIFILTSLIAVGLNVVSWIVTRDNLALAGLSISLAFLLAAQILGFKVLTQLVEKIADRYAEELWSVVNTLGNPDRKEQSNG